MDTLLNAFLQVLEDEMKFWPLANAQIKIPCPEDSEPHSLGLQSGKAGLCLWLS